MVGIKATSQGPVFFAQTRVGKGGKTFKLFKFRTMVVNAEELKLQLLSQNETDGPVFKMQRDPRVTVLGRLLRRYSLDELPQLLNILQGDMSVVGPRPPVPKEVEQYEPWQRRRLSVTPGLTCIWQTSGRSNIGFEEWMRMDLAYIDQWSLSLDVKLILKTFKVVVQADGAY
jgi:lipopolysaccharide/colanic/teichoic acid biosynthesis glycosyltransferase